MYQQLKAFEQKISKNMSQIAARKKILQKNPKSVQISIFHFTLKAVKQLNAFRKLAFHSLSCHVTEITTPIRHLID